MPAPPFLTPVEDSVPKVNNEIAIGENLDFQRKWWRLERAVWSLFLLILICDLLGLFGRGWLSKATRATPDNTLKLDYERIERADTPSIMTFHFGPNAIHNGRIQLYVSESITRPLGAQRIAPEPLISAVGDAGNTYTFAATNAPATVQIELEPSFPGAHDFTVQVPNEPPINAKVFVVP